MSTQHKNDSQSNSVSQEINGLAATALGEQGYLFQQRCLLEISNRAKDWEIDAEEYLTGVKGIQSIVDFVLRYGTEKPYYLVCECKRCHPNYVSWVFAQTETLRKPKVFIATTVTRRTAPKSRTRKGIAIGMAAINLMHNDAEPNLPYASTCIEVSHSPKKRKRISQTEYVRAACTQVMTGLGSVISETVWSLEFFKNLVGSWYFIPVLITTARLYMAEYSPSAVPLDSGVIDPSKLKCDEVGWVFLNFPISMEAYRYWWGEDGLPMAPNILKYEKSKPIVIVNSGHLIELLDVLADAIEPKRRASVYRDH